MKHNKLKTCILAVLLFIQGTTFAQLITFNGTGNLLFPPGAPAQTVGVTTSPCTVTGIGLITGCVVIDNVEINLTHSWVGDIGILLIGPGGQVLELSTGNGGSGDNYINTVFTDMAADFITAGSPPYTGTFRPEGRVTNLNNPYSNGPALGTHTFASTYNGTNADGTWTLYLNDYVPLDIGELISWSITFNLGGAPPVAEAGPDVTICAGQTTTLSASGGGLYQWSNGAATANINVMPTVTTTYTVTVTTPGCGSDTDDVTVQVDNFTPPTITGGGVLCPGASLTLTAEGPGYTGYAWSNGQTTQSININTSGIYTVTVTSSGGCTGTASVTINPASSTTTNILGPGALCAGANATLIATGSFLSYNWSNGASGSIIQVDQPGTYTVTVTNSAGCTGTATKTLAAAPLPAVTFSVANPNVCAGACTTVTASFTGTPPFTLTYSTPTAGTVTQTFPGNSGTFQVCVPALAQPGSLQVSATGLTDANCTCN